MKTNISSGHGSGIASVQARSEATATPSDTGELAGGARFRPDADSGSTKARDRHRPGGKPLQSFINRIAKGVKAWPVISIFKGRAARTNQVSPIDDLNKLRQATLAASGPMRPTGTSVAPADVPPAPPPQASKPSRAAPPAPPPAHLKPRLADASASMDTNAARSPDPEVLALRKQVADLEAGLARMKLLMAQSSATPSSTRKFEAEREINRDTQREIKREGQLETKRETAEVGVMTDFPIEPEGRQVMQAASQAGSQAESPAGSPAGSLSALPLPPAGLDGTAPPAPPPPPADLMKRALKPAQGARSSDASVNGAANASGSDEEEAQAAKPKPVRSPSEMAVNAELNKRLAAIRAKQESAEAVPASTIAQDTGSVSGSSRSSSDDGQQ